MTDTITTIWKKVFTILRENTGRICTTHLAYVALGTILFTPLVGIVGRFLLSLSGQSVLSDFDIAYFLLTPLGMAALILLGALLITILVFEQASLMAIGGGSVQGLHITTMSALYFTARRVRRIFLFAIRLVIRVLIIVLPFLAVGGALAWFLLTDYDINYYLTHKPPVFLLTAAIIGLLLLTMLVVLLRKLLSWSLALPLLLFSNVSPARCFAESVSLTLGHKRLFVTILGTWGVATLLLGSVVLGSVQLLGSKLAPLFFDSITLLVPILGGLVALWTLGNLLVTTLTSGSFASLLLALYEHSGAEIATVDLAGNEQGRQRRMAAPRFALLLIGCTAIAVLVGVWLLNGIQADDNVSVIAHRGAAGKAPENTLASVRQAIKDGTDWVEIDVQETVDGKVVVIHDSDFMKLAGVDMKVWNGSLKELQEIDIGSWFDPKFSTERIPTLADVLEEVRGKARLLIELKYYGHDQQLEQRVVDIVEQAGMVDQVAIMSLKHEGIQKFQALRPDWSTGLLLTKAIGDLSNLDVDFLAVNTAMATSGFIRRTQSAGKQVYVWTVNDQVSMSRMMSLGVDGIITDEPELARTVLVERSELNSIERLLIHTAVLLGRPVPQRTYRDQSP
ncbi:MAG: glycerophosphoryl diester phosphodiesterase membrane domain-containing protein [Deltaproteobacteria bacterium]|nr:glycerophosphoryl diester phosphodiesterase membrane domain-containing protein [Deltaproteobacteria bacterium]